MLITRVLAKTNAVEFEGGFRSGFKQDLEAQPIKFDRKDAKKLDTIALPTGFVLTEMRKGLGRIQDDLFIAAATANALGGAKSARHAADVPNVANHSGELHEAGAGCRQQFRPDCLEGS